MTSTQRAAINGVAAAGALIIVLGIALLIFDLNTVEEICKPYFAGSRDEYCVKGDASLRGFFVIALGIIALIAVFVTARTLKKSSEQSL